MKYVKPNAAARALMEVHVPEDNRKYLTRSDQARRGTCALVAWSIALHDSGYYLVGDFTGDDFGVDLLGNLRGRMTLLPSLKKVTAKEMLRNQMKVVADIVEKDIHSVDSESQIPLDLSHLLRQLRVDEIDCSLLINHASHEEEDAKSALFMKMFNSLKAIELSEPTTYESIISNIGFILDVSGWLKRAMKNAHLHAVLRYNRQWKPNTLEDVILQFLTSGVCYTGDAAGLLDF